MFSFFDSLLKLANVKWKKKLPFLKDIGMEGKKNFYLLCDCSKGKNKSERS